MYQDPKLMEQIKRMEVESLLKLDTPSLEALSYLLRHREMWPDGFVWVYNRCETCAMGLAAQLWERPIRTTNVEHACDDTAMMMQMPYKEASEIFLGKGKWTQGFCLRKITPEMVADQIDAYLSK
jgi:hypothetical protein